jgi:hypothetical protein
MMWHRVKHLVRRFVTPCLSASRTYASVVPSDSFPSLLERLPELFSHLILREWLMLRDVVRLESAFCGGEWLQKALSLPHGQHITLTVNPQLRYQNIKPVLRWALTKNVRLNGIHIDEHLSSSDQLLLAFLTASGTEIRSISCHIDCRNGLSTLFDVANQCLNTEKLAITQFPYYRLHPRMYAAAVWYPAIFGDYDDDELWWERNLSALTVGLQWLTHLSLVNVWLSTEGLATALSHCRHLIELEIRDDCQGIPLEVAIPTLTSLTIVSLYVFDTTLSAIGHMCGQLETLRVFASILYHDSSFFPVTDAGVRTVLLGCPLLRDTDVEYAAGVSTELRVELAKRRDFKTLRVGDWSQMSDSLLQGVLAVSPNLTEVDFTRCSWLTDTALAVCAPHHCPLVTTMTLSECPNVTDSGVRAFVSVLVRLRVLHCLKCPLLGEETLFTAAEYCPLLEELSCPANTSDTAVTRLAESCPNLTVLTFARTEALWDDGLIALATHCVKLKELYVYYCPNITMLGVRALAENCPLLECIGLPLRLAGPQLARLKGRQMKFKTTREAGLQLVVQSIRV